MNLQWKLWWWIFQDSLREKNPWLSMHFSLLIFIHYRILTCIRRISRFQILDSGTPGLQYNLIWVGKIHSFLLREEFGVWCWIQKKNIVHTHTLNIAHEREEDEKSSWCLCVCVELEPIITAESENSGHHRIGWKHWTLPKNSFMN